MTTAPPVARPADPAADPAYDHTVDRAWVHRHAVSEVFVTDASAAGDGSFVVAAQLPRKHWFYTDHPAVQGVVDPLLLQECARQAVTVVAHRYLAVPMQTSALVTSWRAELPRGLRNGDQPVQLRLLVTPHDLRERDGQAIGVRFTAELSLDGEPAGSTEIGAAYLPREQYRDFRALRRSTPPPSSADLPGRGGTDLVSPASVGRSVGDHVVLGDLRSVGEEVVATLDAPPRHPSLYDHPLDHVPGMVLMEAARQLTLLVLGSPSHEVTGLDATFSRFAELDAPVRVTGARVPGGVRVGFEQGGASVAGCTVSAEVLG
ncbi:MAG: ScbA/BarX family gamma-butyrolactone biosynthesis protein [Thermocrispum sp.]